MLDIYLHMRDGSRRVIEYDCNKESPFQALERVYRAEDGTDFMVWDLESISFQRGGVVNDARTGDFSFTRGVVAEDLRALADNAPLDDTTVELLHRAADLLDPEGDR